MNLQLWKQRKKDLNLWKQKKRELHLSYDKIAELTGLPKSTITNLFLGYVTAPRIDTVEAIERALGLDKPAETPPATDTEKFEIVIKIILRGADDGR